MTGFIPVTHPESILFFAVCLYCAVHKLGGSVPETIEHNEVCFRLSQIEAKLLSEEIIGIMHFVFASLCFVNIIITYSSTNEEDFWLIYSNLLQSSAFFCIIYYVILCEVSFDMKTGGTDKSLYIVIPAYNEEFNIEKTVSEWYPIVEKHSGKDKSSRLVVINDGSKDATYEIMQRLAEHYPLFTPLNKENGGHGSAVLYGYRYAIEKGADYIFQTDADGQTNPDEFEQFWDSIDRYDAIIGNRRVRGDGKDRKFVENVVCLLLRLVFGVKVKDANAPYRLMRTSLVAKYIDKLPKDYNLPNIMFTTYFSYFKERLQFVEITFKPRQGGKNSINIKKIVKIGWKAMFDFIKLRKNINK